MKLGLGIPTGSLQEVTLSLLTQRGPGLLEQDFGTPGLHDWSSQANFVLVRVGPAHAAFVQALRKCEILVRDRNADPGCQGGVRLTVGSCEHTRTPLVALREVVEKLRLHRQVKA
jgi:histidinol-phosphate aminotransferase